MADIVVDGMTRVYFVSAIANINAPTTSELNAGIDLTSVLTADGVQGFRPETADVDNSSLASTFNTVTNGRVSFSNTMLRFKKQLTGDTAYTTLVKDTAGYVVIRRWIAQATAWASSQACSVYPIICGETADVDPEANSMAKYEIPVKINSTPKIRSAVA